MNTIKLSVVIPIYNNQESLPELINGLSKVQMELDFQIEVVFIIDGSPDKSYDQLLKLIPLNGFEFQVIKLSRNFGSLSAIREGLKIVRGENVACISADMQESPSILIEFYKKLSSEKFDVVVGNRVSRSDGLLNNLTAGLYWKFYRTFVNNNIPNGGADTFAINFRALKQINSLTEQNTSLVGLLYWIGFRRGLVDYKRMKRKHGKSGWTFRNKVRYLEDSIFSFTNLPIVFLQIIGMFGIIISFIITLSVLIYRFYSPAPIPGYTALMITILASTSSILFGLGIVGSYTWRAYENTKNRPTAIIESHEKY